MTDKKKIILEAVEKLTDTYRKEELFLGKDRERLPNKKEIINFIKDMRSIIFPGYFSVDSSASVFPEHYVAYRLNDLYDCLQEQIEIAFLYQGEEEQKAKEHAEQITERFFANVPEIQRMLLTDLQAGFDGDPAAKSKEEIIFSYPAFQRSSSRFPGIPEPPEPAVQQSQSSRRSRNGNTRNGWQYHRGRRRPQYQP